MSKKKFVVLLDPNKGNISNAFLALKRLYKEEPGACECMELWVGCSTSGGMAIKGWVARLRKNGMGPIFVFPGRLRQGLFSYSLSDFVIIPVIINYSSRKAKLKNVVGDLVGKLVSRSYRVGYLVSKRRGSVARVTGARDLLPEEVEKMAEKFIDCNPDARGVYLEAGSGSKKTFALKTVRRVRKILCERGDFVLIVGGGVRTPERMLSFYRAGADKVVVGTVLEQDTGELAYAKLRAFYDAFIGFGESY